MNIFFRELRANFKSLLIWSGIIVLFSLVGFSKFSAFYNNPELLVMLDSLPPALVSAFNMDAFNLTTVTGFYGIMVMYTILMLTISAVMWGSDIITKEERDRTVEFSLTLPVTRARLVTAKIAAALVNCVALLLVSWGSTLLGAQRYQPDSEFYRFVALSMVASLLVQLIFLALGIFLGCALKRYKLAGSVSIGVLLAAYFTSFVYDLKHELTYLRYVSPFNYFDPLAMLRENKVEPTFVLLSLAIVAVLLAAGYLTYQRRDLYI